MILGYGSQDYLGSLVANREPVRYLGSKTSTLSALQRLVTEHVQVPGTLCDPFGGTGVVGAHFRTLGWKVHTGDLLHCAHHFQVARVVTERPPLTSSIHQATGAESPEEFVAYLQNLKPIESYIYREFAMRRQFFTPANASQIDAVRRMLGHFRRTGVLSGLTAAYYSACLIEAVDRVANTAGTYYAHLKRWDRKALQPFVLRLIEPAAGPQGKSTIGDATEISSEQHWDVLYLDPPYNDRDYAAYYHLPETLATGRRPRPQGRSGVDAADRPRSAFSSPRTATAALRELLSTARFRILVMHYTDRGLIPSDWLRCELSRYGDVEEHMIEALGYSNVGTRSVMHRLYVVIT